MLKELINFPSQQTGKISDLGSWRLGNGAIEAFHQEFVLAPVVIFAPPRFWLLYTLAAARPLASWFIGYLALHTLGF